jgi:hypothetical protein
MTSPDDRISLGAPPYPEDDGPDLGPDERDLDLMDGSWEDRYYGGRIRRRDWQSVGIALSLLLVIALTVPAILVFTR